MADDELAKQMQQRMQQERERRERLDAALADGEPLPCERCGKMTPAEEVAGNSGWCNGCAWGLYFIEP